jgi:hypothetical protein
MITVTHTFETPAALADWIATQPHAGQLTVAVGTSTMAITYGDPPRGATVECVVGLMASEHSFSSAQDATKYFVGRIRAAADASAESYAGKP